MELVMPSDHRILLGLYKVTHFPLELVVKHRDQPTLFSLVPVSLHQAEERLLLPYAFLKLLS